ncbi:MAG: hypothetical protein GX964_11040 [Syntrophomonadaceae bacterium]|nr:hypothetical protein [Syntrophomonadaceae bacterium]
MLPKTASGKWAATLSIAFIILMALKMRLPFPLPSFFIAALGLGGFVTGIIALTKKDRTILVFLSILVGLVIIFWIAAELIYPH